VAVRDRDGGQCLVALLACGVQNERLAARGLRHRAQRLVLLGSGARALHDDGAGDRVQHSLHVRGSLVGRAIAAVGMRADEVEHHEIRAELHGLLCSRCRLSENAVERRAGRSGPRSRVHVGDFDTEHGALGEGRFERV
jgi:hypothetical protein